MLLTFEMMFLRMKAAQRFRENLIRLMKEHHLSGSDLARLMDIDPAVISRWIRGKHKANFDSMDEICEKTGWALEEFLRPLEDEPEPRKVTPAQVVRSAGDVNEALGLERPKVKKKHTKKAN